MNPHVFDSSGQLGRKQDLCTRHLLEGKWGSGPMQNIILQQMYHEVLFRAQERKVKITTKYWVTCEFELEDAGLVVSKSIPLEKL